MMILWVFRNAIIWDLYREMRIGRYYMISNRKTGYLV